MTEAFIIMQIGNEELDHLCKVAIVPALKACGLDAKRVDKHNQGGLLKSEIIGFIKRAEIIVADLTNERPNCYLEIGYAMGIDKFRNLILTAREDHFPESENYTQGGPKVHFDLGGYDILYWHPDKIDEFRKELEKRIRRRQAVLVPAVLTPTSPWDDEWISSHRETALTDMSATGLTGFMEIRFVLDHPKPWKTQRELDEAARESTLDTFGWPIGVYLGNRDEHRPRPEADGIVAQIAIDDRSSYDYWTIRRNGDFYLLKTIFEDTRDGNKIFFNTRIVRVTETLLYCARLYSRLEVDPTTIVNVAVRHGGLDGRILSASNPGRTMSVKRISSENEIESVIRSSLSGLETDLVELVKELLAPLFTVFDFFKLSDDIYEQIVNDFVQGRVT